VYKIVAEYIEKARTK